MADDFKKKMEAAKKKLPKGAEPKGEVSKLLAETEKTIDKKTPDYVDKIRKLIGAIGKQKKETKDATAKKAMEEMEAVAKTDMEKRLKFKDKSGKPS